MRRRPRFLFDTNVIFSGLYSPHGPPGRLLDRYADGELAMVVSRQVLGELVRTVENKLPQALPALYLLLPACLLRWSTMRQPTR